MRDRPTPGGIETRSAPDIAPPRIDGRRLHGVIPFGVESRDLGGFREVMSRGSLADADMSDLIATVDHAGVPLARFPTTLEVESRDDGLHWSLELPESRSDVREAIERGDLRATSWRMVVGRDRWSGDVRHVESVSALRDVSIVSTAAYPDAAAEYRAAPDPQDPPPAEATDPPEGEEETPMDDDQQQTGGLTVEDRTAPPEGETRTVAERAVAAIHAIEPGEARSLTVSSAEPIEPPEISSMLFDRMRPLAIALASGISVHPTTNREVTFPQITSDVSPTWVASGEEIPEDTPALTALSAEPRKLAHRCELENEVIDDSEPSVQAILDQHLATMLALKLDRSLFEGNPSADADSIRGLKFTPGIIEIQHGGTNGGPLTNYDVIIRAIGRLRSANVPGPFVVAMHPDRLTDLELLKDEDGSSRQLPMPAGMPPMFTSSQLSTTETSGTSNDTCSIYVYSPSQLWLIDRQDAEISIDRSRLYHRDMSEMRAKLRVDLLVPNPVAVVRIKGVRPAA